MRAVCLLAVLLLVLPAAAPARAIVGYEEEDNDYSDDFGFGSQTFYFSAPTETPSPDEIAPGIVTIPPTGENRNFTTALCLLGGTSILIALNVLAAVRKRKVSR